MQQRRGTAEQWESVNPVLAAGEIGFETDTNKFKIGDGVNDWETLVYFLDADSSGGQVGDFIPTSQKAQPDGVATLDVNGQVPANQLGNASVDLSDYATESYVDDAISNIPPTDLSGYATEQYVNTAIDNVVGLAPEDLNTLSELADALGDNPDAITTLQSDVAALQNEKGEPLGTATLDANGQVPASQLSNAGGGGVDLSLKADLINGFVDPAQLNNINLVESKFVAVQSGTDNSAYSEDGITWVQSKMPLSTSWISVVSGNGRFLATSFNYFGAYSTNGITWTQSDLPTPSFSSSWRSTAYGNDKFVALDFNNSTNSAYSTDAITWAVSTLPAQAYWNPIAYGDGKFVAVAVNSTTAAYSTNGITWTQTSMPASVYWDGVVYGNDKFVAVARGTATAAYSTDGISWTQSTIPGQSWDSVTYGNGKFVAVADFSNVAAYSTNGITWTQTSMPSYNFWASVTYGNDKFISVARNSTDYAYSTDGISWTQSTMPTYETWHSVAHGVTSITSVPIASENYVNSEIESINSDLLNKADTNSPTFTGLTDFEGIVDFSEATVIGIETGPVQSSTPHPFSMIG